nr:EOG090X0E3B [Cyclestheria hislopi]
MLKSSAMLPSHDRPSGILSSLTVIRFGLFVFLVVSFWTTSASAIELMKLFEHRTLKRAGEPCHPYEPFKCPGDGACISIQYLCDGAADCPDGYDEDLRLCTAANRPPVEETASFLQSLLNSHGPNFLEKMFGTKARNALAPLGGVERVAIAISESQTIGDFGTALHLMRSDLEHLRSIFVAVQNGDLAVLTALGIKDSELGDVKFFLEKLIKTGFLD